MTLPTSGYTPSECYYYFVSGPLALNVQVKTSNPTALLTDIEGYLPYIETALESLSDALINAELTEHGFLYRHVAGNAPSVTVFDTTT